MAFTITVQNIQNHNIIHVYKNKTKYYEEVVMGRNCRDYCISDMLTCGGAHCRHDYKSLIKTGTCLPA
jgi:hypothetical protein